MEKSWGKNWREVGKDVGKVGETWGRLERRGEDWRKVVGKDMAKIGERGGEYWRKVFEKRLAIVFY